MPVVRACVHDGIDTTCGAVIPGFSAAVPPGCADLEREHRAVESCLGG